jgi:FtsH-binding integral membrane protein
MNYKLFSYLATPKQKSMAEKNTTQALFNKDNYLWMLIGLVVIAIGMFLLSGGKSNNDPAVFNKDAVYSTTRITIAPILILAGLVIEIFAIFRKPKTN